VTYISFNVHKFSCPPPPPEYIRIYRRTNPGLQIAMVTKFCTVVPKICGSSVGNLLHIPLPDHKIL
jgi:hypothetical protein